MCSFKNSLENSFTYEMLPKFLTFITCTFSMQIATLQWRHLLGLGFRVDFSKRKASLHFNGFLLGCYSEHISLTICCDHNNLNWKEALSVLVGIEI
jgi:uncharacterized membrane protein required for colicin V production